MTDKNGNIIRTGDVVEITGAYFKNDNGLYYVERSPGDPTWQGNDLSLRRISKTGKISKAKHNIGFWPISVFVNDHFKRYEAKWWNKEHAKIEVKTITNVTELVDHFRAEANRYEEESNHYAWQWGEDTEYVKQCRFCAEHCRAVANRVAAKA